MMAKQTVRIESDGTYTKLWVNGEEILDGTMLDFHAEPSWVTCEYWQYEKSENGKYLVLNNDVVQKKHTIDFESKEQE